MLSPTSHIRLDEQLYTLAKDPKSGTPLFSVSSRPSQPGDPGQIVIKEWQVWGHDLLSTEGPDGFLGREYGANTDGRWDNTDTLGPLINTVTLGTYDSVHAPSIPTTPTAIPTATLIPGGSFGASTGVDAIEVFQAGKIYLARQIFPAKVNGQTMALERAGFILKEPCTSLLATKAATNVLGAHELTFAQGEAAPYLVLTAVGTHPNSDSTQEPADGSSARILGIAPDRVVGLVDTRSRGNILTGAVTMRAPNWSTVATHENEEFTFTGFAMDGNRWVEGTSKGPYFLDVEQARFTQLLPETDNDTENGRQMGRWSFLGVIVPLRYASRYQRDGNGQSFGVETFLGNSSPVTGYGTAQAGAPRWLYQAVYNESTTDTYLIAWRPRQLGDHHSNPLSPYVIAKFTALQCRALKSIGTLNGLRANPTLVGGYGSDMFWLRMGRTSREIDDANYTFAASGTSYYTEYRTPFGMLADIECWEYESASHTSTETSTVGASINGGTAVTFPAVSANAYNRVLAVTGEAPHPSMQGAYRIKPQMAYARGATTTLSPKVVGPLRCRMRLRPQMVDVYEIPVELRDHQDKTERELEALLLEDLAGKPVKLTDDRNRDSVFVRVESVTVQRVEYKGGDQTSPRGSVKVATIRATTWVTDA